MILRSKFFHFTIATAAHRTLKQHVARFRCARWRLVPLVRKFVSRPPREAEQKKNMLQKANCLAKALVLKTEKNINNKVKYTKTNYIINAQRKTVANSDVDKTEMNNTQHTTSTRTRNTIHENSQTTKTRVRVLCCQRYQQSIQIMLACRNDKLIYHAAGFEGKQKKKHANTHSHTQRKTQTDITHVHIRC